MNKFFKIFLVFGVLLLTANLISCSTSSSSGGEEEAATSSTSSETSDSSSTSASSNKSFQVAVYHSGKTGYEILAKIAKVNGVQISSNGKNKSSYKRISGSGTLHYSTYENIRKGGKTSYNHPTGSGNYNFKNGKKYTINCANGNISED